MDKEIQMNATSGQEDHKSQDHKSQDHKSQDHEQEDNEQEDPKPVYTTPARVQAWFLQRSRRNWKRKYMELKANEKRLENRVHDVTKSREKWRDEAQQLKQRIQELEAENATLLAGELPKKKRTRPLN
jgi:hypothetical protein